MGRLVCRDRLTEDRFNYVMAAISDDDGKNWSDLKFVINPDGDGPRRASDPCFWLDPSGKLWLFWWMNGGGLNVTMSITTENPDAENPSWTETAGIVPRRDDQQTDRHQKRRVADARRNLAAG